MTIFKNSLRLREKEYTLGLLGQYRQGRIPLLVLQSLLTSWTLKYEKEYLQGQTCFNPDPGEPFALADSGKGSKP